VTLSGIPRSLKRAAGFTLLEVLIVVTIVGVLAAIAMPAMSDYLEKVRVSRAIVEIRTLEKEIYIFQSERDSLPDSLAGIDRAGFLDPWGHPYQYLLIAGAAPMAIAKFRKDRFLVPLNSDYDLYSRGPDGESLPPLTAKKSRDDILRANDGGYVGLASQY
jgi:general secretion pathway protein G